MGIAYLHGRCMDGSPVMYLDLVRVQEMLKKDLICENSFGSLHNFFAGYINRNMLVPGQVEKWLIILNINHFSIKMIFDEIRIIKSIQVVPQKEANI